ncbi:LysR family transcriptional regulator [Pallidibacillus pasinlerensis]|uniref:LysR family transcriptional regulator n=1 Tax=Pallidibacillus pasinlerensis TaxID=2703818 RepID=A0ABX0A571_9BACI|nr:LysR family transcriptional regulator [Pallidibacillus pasinlerensis]NCU18582.1 LysR family transcriptional regulator [Pallidibacillus pasinlerensis]
MNYLALRYFIEVANTLNFSQAAENLHISQPGLSQQITSIEEQLGFKLFHRTTRKVTLTEEGNYLYKSILPAFENIESTVKEMEKTGLIPQTSIKIATVPSAASNWLPKLLNQLKDKLGEFEFYIQETSSTKAIELIKKRESDIAFIRTPVNVRELVDQQLEILELTKHPLQLVVPANHPVAGKEEVDLFELKDEPFLHYDPIKSPSLYHIVEQACLTAGFIPKILGIGPELLTIANLISNGIGVTLMPRDMVELLPTEKIKAINIINEKVYSSISVIWNKGGNVPLLTQYALNILEEYAKEAKVGDGE